ncbi:MAG TPA: NUDIX hydrolase [Pseudonocardiaceae bacterium]
MRVGGVAMVAGLLGAAAGLVGVVRMAGRLDRLHVRTDAAWGALDAALSRRARVVGGPGGGCPSAAEADAADAALRAERAAREDAENELGRVLAVLDRTRLDPVRAAQLADAEQRIVIARRVYNDAVRDTLALRSHRMVRWLRLSGTAPLPRYFEIAEPSVPG